MVLSLKNSRKSRNMPHNPFKTSYVLVSVSVQKSILVDYFWDDFRLT